MHRRIDTQKDVLTEKDKCTEEHPHGKIDTPHNKYTAR